MVVPNFVRQALANEPITVFGDGKQSRCFTHVSDVVRALIGLLDSEASYGHVFNIGNNTEISMNDLAKTVREMCKSKSEIVHIPYEKAYEEGFEDMPRRVPDLSKIAAAIDWKPTIPLPQILTDVIEFQRRTAV
jgi:UDP-glucose 4-epimerase